MFKWFFNYRAQRHNEACLRAQDHHLDLAELSMRNGSICEAVRHVNIANEWRYKQIREE